MIGPASGACLGPQVPGSAGRFSIRQVGGSLKVVTLDYSDRVTRPGHLCGVIEGGRTVVHPELRW